VLLTGAFAEPYDIVPSFEHWEFPHDSFSSSGWKTDIPRSAAHPTPRQSTLTETILSRDVRCRVTKHIEGTEIAHLVPRSLEIWFQQNIMSTYGTDTRPTSEPIDNPRNAILLRSDIHTSFDYKRFAFVPKPQLATTADTASADESMTYVMHIFSSPEPHELTSLYHNVCLQTLSGIAPEYLFARFAWTIFQFIPIFLRAGIPRRLALNEPSGNTVSLNAAQKQSKWVNGEACRLLPTRSKSRSLSPKKRKPADEDSNVDPSEYESMRRGRKRHRADSDSFIESPIETSFSSENTREGPWYTGASSDPDAGTDLSDAQSGDEGHRSLSDPKQDIPHIVDDRHPLLPGSTVATT
jgi:hypothetical protein